jgi:hypothetical protein
MENGVKENGQPPNKDTVLENENVQPQEPNATFNNPGFENDEEKF